MKPKVIRAITFNILGFSFLAAHLIFTRHRDTTSALLSLFLLCALVFSRIRPVEATARFRPWEWAVWFGGFTLVVLVALGIARLGWAGKFDVRIIAVWCTLGWAFTFLIVRDAYLASGNSSQERHP